jgi:mRNA interferase HigB
MGTRYTQSVRIIARSTLTRFVKNMAGQRDQRAVKAALDAWFHEVDKSNWTNSADVKKSYANASIVGSDRVVFNIKGNDYRLITAVDFKRKIVFIKWLGTHAAYDKVDARTVRYED